MSTCGYILPNYVRQLSPSQRTTLLADSIIFVNSSDASGAKHIPYHPKFKSGREYLQFKKARIMSKTNTNTKAIQPSIIITQLNDYVISENLCP